MDLGFLHVHAWQSRFRRLAAFMLAAVLLAACASGTSDPAGDNGNGNDNDTEAPGESGEPVAEPRSLTVAIQGNWPPINTARLAGEFTFYEEENLTVEFVTVRSAPDAVTGLIGGSIDIIITATDFMIPVVRGDADLVTVASTLNVAPFDLITAPELTEREDLVGKTIGVVNEQGVSTVAFMQQMQDAGVDTSSFELILTGNTGERYSALAAGQVDATTVGPPFGFIAEEQGMNNLGFSAGGADPRPLVTAALTVDRSWAETAEGRDTLVRFLRALQRFVDFAYEEENLGELSEATARVMDLDDERYAELAWEWIWELELLPRDLHVDPTGMLSFLQGFVEMGGELGADIPTDPTPYFDHSYLEQARASLTQG